MAPGICYGRSDLVSADDPVACAAKLYARLPQGLPLYTSPLRRCVDLARALHPAPIMDDRLVEMDFGDWEMQAWDNIPRGEIDAWSAAPLDYAPPGGEPATALRDRVRAFLREHAGQAGLVAVTHAGVMKLFAAELLGLPTHEWLSLRFEFGEAFVIEA